MAPKRVHADVDIGQAITAPFTRSHTDSIEEDESPSPNARHSNVDPAGPGRKKSEPVKSACSQCQKRKTKCSGRRPTCGFCSDRGLDCSWEIGDGLTRNADLRQRLTEANLRSVDINMLVNDMRSNTDAVATTLLAKLRLGDSIEDLAMGIRDGTSFAQNRIYKPRRRPTQQTSER